MTDAHVRLWGCWPDRVEMEPFWGPYKLGDWLQHRDVGDDIAAREIEDDFARIKRFPPTPHAGQTSETYGTLYKPGIPHQPATPRAATSGYQTSYATSYPLLSTALGGASTGQYVYSVPSAQTKPDIQMGSFNDEPMDEADEEGEGSYEDSGGGDDDKERSGDFVVGDEVGPQQTASRLVLKDHLVHVTKKTHTLGSDEFIFKDAKGKKRSTKQKDWQKTTFNGQPAWRYHHYIGYEILK